jgi:hypothetical protein
MLLQNAASQKLSWLLISFSDVLPFGRPWYTKVGDAIANVIGHAKFLQTLTTSFHLPPAFGDSEAASFWKRGSPRSGSNIGSSRTARE